jgi:hypothetical protein
MTPAELAAYERGLADSRENTAKVVEELRAEVARLRAEKDEAQRQEHMAKAAEREAVQAREPIPNKSNDPQAVGVEAREPRRWTLVRRWFGNAQSFTLAEGPELEAHERVRVVEAGGSVSDEDVEKVLGAIEQLLRMELRAGPTARQVTLNGHMKEWLADRREAVLEAVRGE